MRKLLFYFLLTTTPVLLQAQIGLKGESIPPMFARDHFPTAVTGFMAELLLAPPTKGIMASRQTSFIQGLRFFKQAPKPVVSIPIIASSLN